MGTDASRPVVSFQRVSDNYLDTMVRLAKGDRIVWQENGDDSSAAVWWDKPPHRRRPQLWVSTCRHLHKRGFIVEGLQPKDSDYKAMRNVRMYVLTPDGMEELNRQLARLFD